ncbi:arfGTPase-activating protein [Reticulomyxa filosa]|uniref:ArfGTPase-activating protein n=1 Tax=Reticulomyxa filosa TaxID=46433 RepID=X6NS02_RETFI|nr:arfGTPase-activating protein [Reticulomyxa filosa]|eukprot:ETO29060.1 arfGTPase-activating protein [Reticulomyxa filosa]
MLAEGGTNTEEPLSGNDESMLMDTYMAPHGSNSNGHDTAADSNDNNDNNDNDNDNDVDIKTSGDNGDDKTKELLAAQIDKEYAFAIATSKRTYVLCAKDTLDLFNWRNAIEKATFGGRLFQGWLIKRGAMRKSWKKRWFVIFDTHEMRYFDNQQNMQPIGSINLLQVLLMCPGDDDQYSLLLPYTIQLLTPDRNWVVAAETEQKRNEWLSQLKESIDGAKQLVTSQEGYLWKQSSKKTKSWKKHYFAMSKGWLFYFDSKFHCDKFKTIVFFNESFFQQAVQMYVKGTISLHQTVVQRVYFKSFDSLPLPSNPSNDVQPHFFQITTNFRKHCFACEAEPEFHDWFKAFHKTHEDGLIAEIHSELELKTQLDEEEKKEEEKSDRSQLPTIIEDEKYDDEDTQFEPDRDPIQHQIDAQMQDNTKYNIHKGHSQKQASLFNLLDPNGTGKWRDLEDPSLIRAQPDLVKNINTNSHSILQM